MSWQSALMTMVRAERPSMLLLLFQKPMSFLNASMSNTECSTDTTVVTPSSHGLPSMKMRFKSSLSLSCRAGVGQEAWERMRSAAARWQASG